MPIRWEELDSSTREENLTIILGKNILIKMVEDPNKQTLLKNHLVKKLLSIRNLCNDDTRQLIEKLLIREGYLNAPSFVQTLMQHPDKLKDFAASSQWVMQALAPLTESQMWKALEKTARQTVKHDEKLFRKEDLRADLLRRVKGRISKKNLEKLEKEIISIDEQIEARTGIRLTEPSVLFVCSRCKSILFENEISNKKCLSCNRKITEDIMKRIPIVRVALEIRQVWQSNLWFEAYFANLLSKLGCKTWVGIHAMGGSGILHEVDVLAIRNGTVLICECKTGKISRNDVFNFCTKANDLKSHISILALMGELPEPETREFVRKNPAIIRLENMGQMSEVAILEDLKNRLSIKA